MGGVARGPGGAIESLHQQATRATQAPFPTPSPAPTDECLYRVRRERVTGWILWLHATHEGAHGQDDG
ncbi:MAG TPA: hypothetical protein VGT44_03520, partial [Ktedonobacteraceae bacterium]|nr:hypothetical protein [Ktedonobacteraceae bacterium]